jgi:hypothetical protein
VSDEIRRLAEIMAEQHRPVSKPDVMAVVEQYTVQCAACDRNTWTLWRPGDLPYLGCEIWQRAVALGLVA